MTTVRELYKAAEAASKKRMAAPYQKEEWEASIVEAKAYAAYYQKSAAQGVDGNGNKLDPSEITNAFETARFYEADAEHIQSKYERVFGQTAKTDEDEEGE